MKPNAKISRTGERAELRDGNELNKLNLKCQVDKPIEKLLEAQVCSLDALDFEWRDGLVGKCACWASM